ncbi:SPOR domain-containing protein [Hippea jasoniae]|uniref:SPOR domain-containing protein n=1 Tax=Hippea jasoniae TaxID=944479 RepID=UPI00054E1E8B|nr:SPOR domain-containing protein [Hippea jasoniae]
MADPENKDKIKEILEGHSKKFSTAEIIVGIVVVLIIGVGAGYAIFKLILPPPTPIEYQTQPINEQQNIQLAQTPKQAPLPQPEINNKENQPNQNQTTPPQQEQQAVVGNNTETQQAQITTQTQKQTQGPEIINPYKKTTQKPKLQTKPASTHKPKLTTKKTSHAKHYIATRHSKVKKHKTTTRKYILQVSSNSNRKFAIATVLKLRKCGHKAYTKEIEIKGKKYTRVYVGPIKGYEAAKDEAENIKRQLHLGYLPIIKRYDKVP